MERRRALMMEQEEALPPVPSGYITNGLVFFLDGKQLASSTKWKDIVGGKEFTLIDCTVGTNGIVFNGTSSRGEYNGYITNNWENETIEVVFYGLESIKTKCLFSQPMVGGNAGIGLRFGDDGDVRLATGQVAQTHQWFRASIYKSANRISVAATQDITGGVCCHNGSNVTSNSSSSYAKNETGITCLGCRKTTNPSTFYSPYKGTIHAIRIYNRKLTLAEMQSNQATDLTYYNL